MTTVCPSDLELRRYALGDCPDDSFAQIEQHLAACASCEETIARFDSTDDTLMRHLPLAAGNTAPEGEEPVGWMESLRQGPPVASALHPVPAFEPTPGVPDQLANYELLQVIGQGGMGVVFLAEHRQLKRRVAIKVVSPRVMSGIEAQRRFQREIEVLGGLHHPGIVMATDAGRLGQGAYLVMELIDGADLSRLVRVGGPLAIPEACETARQIALALAAAHACGAVHRDVKPSNVMVDRKGRAQLLDFGLAQMATAGRDSLDTSVGRLLGTIEYMAPEQIEGSARIDPRADLYGLGALLFFLLTGQPPHGSRSQRPVLEHLRSIANNDAPRLATLRADVPPELDDFVAQLLSRDPEDRPETADSVADALSCWSTGHLAGRVREFLDSLPAPAPSPDDREAAKRSLTEVLELEAESPPATAASTPPRRRWPLLTALAALAGMVLWGMIITLQTPQGTLRIESEVGDVQVEVVDDQDESQDLDISQGPNNETVLRAGKYRVRFKGKTDGLRIVGDVITLRKGETVVAKIVRTTSGNEEAGVPDSAPAPPLGLSPSELGLQQLAKQLAEYSGQGPSQEELVKAWIRQNGEGSGSEPIYQGLPESEWQRRFQAETEPIAKLDAGRALLSLAAGRPDEEVIERILFVGEEIVRAGWGSRAWEMPLERQPLASVHAAPSKLLPGTAMQAGPRGGGRGRGLVDPAGEASRAFNDSLDALSQKIDRKVYANAICDAAVKGKEPRAAFALALLFGLRPIDLARDPATLPIVLQKLNAPITSERRSQLLILTRGRFVALSGPGMDASDVFDGLTALATLLNAAPLEANLQLENQLHYTGYVMGYWNRSVFPEDYQSAMARLVLRDLSRGQFVEPTPPQPNRRNIIYLNPAESGEPCSGFSAELASSPSPRAAARLAEEFTSQGRNPASSADPRAQFAYFLDQWLPVANAWLAEHPHEFDSVQFRKVVRSMFLISQLRQPDDDWPVEETAQLLTELLKSYYDLPNNTAPMPTQWDDPNAAMLLGTIVRLTGELPAFVNAPGETPLRSRRLVARNWGDGLTDAVTRFNQQTQSSPTALDYFTQRPEGLFDPFRDEPLRIVQWSVQPGPVLENFTGSDQFLAAAGGSGLAFHYTRSSVKLVSGSDTFASIDPVLLLALLNNFTGESGAQDGRIDDFFSSDAPAGLLASSIDQRLSSDLAVKPYIVQWLTEMRAKSKSEELTAALAKFTLPDVRPGEQPMADGGPTGGDIPPASNDGPGDAPAAVYKGHTEAEWQRIFLAEQDGASKLDAGQALLFLADGRPQEEVLERLLFVGEEIVRDGIGDEAFRLPLRAHGLAYTPFPRWSSSYLDPIDPSSPRFGSGPEMNPVQEASQRLDQIIAQRTGEVPPQILAAALSSSAMQDGPPRAAFALWLLGQQAFSSNGFTPREDVDEELRDIVIRELDAPVTADLRSQVTALTRFRFLLFRPELSQEDLAGMTQLAQLLSEENSWNRWGVERTFHRLAGFLGTRHLVPVPREFQRTSAELVLRDITREHPLERPILVAKPFSPRVPSEEGGAGVANGRSNVGRGRGFGGSRGQAASRRGPTGEIDLYPDEWLNRQKQRFSAFAQVLARENVLDLSEESPAVVNRCRESFAYFLDEWLPVATHSLSDGSLQPFSEEYDNVIRSLWVVSQLRKPGDDWPVQSAIDELTKVLATFFIPPEQAGPEPADWAAVNPAILLGTILRLGGEVPEFVIAGKSSNEAARQWVERLPELVRAANDPGTLWAMTQPLTSLRRTGPIAQVPPYTLEPIRILDWATQPDAAIDFPSSGVFMMYGGTSGFSMRRDRDGNEAVLWSLDEAGSEFDPVVILAAMNTLTGRTAEQDARIENFFSDQPNSIWFRTAVERLLASDFAEKTHVQRWLTEMRAKSKSEELTAALAKFTLPDVAPGDPMTANPPPAGAGVPIFNPLPPNPPEPVYKGRTESEWQRIFLAETVPEAKLETATALLSLAAGRSDEVIIQRVLDVGEEVVRAGYGERQWELVLEGYAHSPIAYPNWPTLAPAVKQGDSYRGVIADFSRELGSRVDEVEIGPLAMALATEVVESEDPRAAMALFLIHSKALVRIINEPESCHEVLAKLDVAPAQNRRSMVTQLVRLQLAAWGKGRDDDEIQSAITALGEIAPGIVDESISVTPREAELLLWIGSFSGQNDGGISIPQSLQRAVAVLMLRSMPLTEEEQAAWRRAEADLKNRAAQDAAEALGGRGGRGGRGGSGRSLGNRERLLVDFRSTRGAAGPTGILKMDDVDPLWSWFNYRIANPASRLQLYSQPAAQDDANYPDPQTLAGYRRKGEVFIGEWFPVVNDYLETHSAQFDDWQYTRALAATEILAAARMTGDDWPLDRTAELLTRDLRAFYEIDGETGYVPNEYDPLRAATFLGPIVRMTGEIPEFARAGRLRSSNVRDGLENLDAQVRDVDDPKSTILDGLSDPRLRGGGRGGSRGRPTSLSNLARFQGDPLFDDPVTAIGWVVNDEAFFSQLGTPAWESLLVVNGLGSQPSTDFGGSLLRAELQDNAVRWSGRAGGTGNRGTLSQRLLRNPVIDPVLLLAILHDLTGKSETQDARIEDFFSDEAPAEMLVTPIREYLASDFAAKTHIKSWLTEMAEKSKSPELSAAVRKLDPSLAAAVPAAPRFFEGKSEEQWQREFQGTGRGGPSNANPVSARGWMNAAAGGSDAHQLGVMLDIGEALVQRAHREFPFDVAIRNVGYDWRPFFSGGPSGAAAKERFIEDRNRMLEKLDPVILVDGLCEAAISGDDFRAAFALSLLHSPVFYLLPPDTTARQRVVSKLAIPLESGPRGGIATLIRVKYATITPSGPSPQAVALLRELAKWMLDHPEELDAGVEQMFYEVARDLARSGQDFSPEFQSMSAQLILRSLKAWDNIEDEDGASVTRSRSSEREFQSTRNFRDFLTGADPRRIGGGGGNGARLPEPDAHDMRLNAAYFLAGWLPVATEYLADPNVNVAGRTYSQVLSSVSQVLPLQTSTNNWPTAQLADIIEKQLAEFFTKTQGPIAPIDRGVFPQTLILPIVLIRGQLPPILRDESLLSDVTRESLAAFEKLRLDPAHQGSELRDLLRRSNSFSDRTIVRAWERDVRHVIGWIVEPDAAFSGWKLPASTGLYILFRSNLSNTSIVVTGDEESTRVEVELSDRLPFTPVEPLLLLAILHDLTGKSEMQDYRIADFFNEEAPPEMLVEPLRQYLASDFAVKSPINTWLTEMAEKSKSPVLNAAIQKLIAVE